VPGGIASPSGSRRMGNGAEHVPTNPFGDVTVQIRSRRARTRTLRERGITLLRPLTKMPTHF
jgi:hypothetical protein